MSERTIRTLLCSVAATACMLLGAATAGAAPDITSFDGHIDADAGGTPATQAGSHPYSATTTFTFASHIDPDTGSPVPDEDPKTISVDLPPGLVGDPSALPTCTEQQLGTFPSGCPAGSAVGIVNLDFLGMTQSLPVYNMVPPPGTPAEFGFTVLVAPVHLRISIRPDDGGLTATLDNVSQALPITGSSLTLWGVPADPSHDPLRGQCLNFDGTSLGNCPANTPVKPFLTLPTSCSGPQTTSLRVDSWQHPGSFSTASFLSHDNSNVPIGADGCDKLHFDPSISVHMGSSQADSPAGLDVDLHVSQDSTLGGLATAHVKKTVVTLPAGVSVNPAGADGLAACTPAQIGLGNSDPVACPDASKVGSTEIDSPLLPDPLRGSLYIAQQDANPFHSLLALYLVAEADGVRLKLPGKVDLDPASGQLVTTFDNTPQLPFSDFKLSFFGGPRAALATPPGCGTFTASAEVTPHSAPATGPPAALSDSFLIDSGCGAGFNPSFSAGTTNAVAGAGTGFTLSLGRADGDQHLGSISTTLPPGVIAKIGSVPLCGEADAAAGSCPAASQVGTATTGSGAGSHPFYLGGKVFLTGPYKGAPFGLSIVVPAVAGPLNLGTVAVRAAVNVDPHDTHLTVVSDPFPSILQGIPLRLRSISVNLDRPGFMLNPTSCDPMQITGTAHSLEGAAAALGQRFQVGGCRGLRFAPKLRAAFTGGRARTVKGSHPGLNVKLTTATGDANAKSIALTLPSSTSLDLGSLPAPCSRTAWDAHACPAATRVGSASAATPLLSGPLTGPVYLIAAKTAGAAPGLGVLLRGQITVALEGDTAFVKKSLRTTFGSVPDVPLSSFQLTIDGGRGGILSATRNLCAKKQAVSLRLVSQTGAAKSSKLAISRTCAKSRKHRPKSRKHKASRRSHH